VTVVRRRTLRLTFVTACSLAAGAAVYPVTALEVENSARGQATRIALREGEPFSITSQHSLYDRPVTEEFVVRADRRIALQSVSSPSAAVREYFGISFAGDRHAVAREMREIVFRVAVGTPQRLQVGRLEWSFLQLGDHGDRLVIRAIRRPALFDWLARAYS
jgi:hypothetical protein